LGTAGVAVAAAVVVMLGGVPARFVAVNVKGPPARPVVIFCIATSGIAGLTIFVNTQFICARARTLAAGMVRTDPVNVPKLPDGFPEAAKFPSLQLADEMVKFVATVSVIVTAVPVALARIGVVTVG
jgi:hypothetical protein